MLLKYCSYLIWMSHIFYLYIGDRLGLVATLTDWTTCSIGSAFIYISATSG